MASGKGMEAQEESREERDPKPDCTGGWLSLALHPLMTLVHNPLPLLPWVHRSTRVSQEPFESGHCG